MSGHRVVGIVSGDETERATMSSCLEQVGMETVSFGTISDVLSWLDSGRRFELAVVSLGLAGMDGWRLCRMLRSPRYSQPEPVRIVAVAALHPGEDAAVLAADLGAEDLVREPVDPNRLASSVRRALLGASGDSVPVALIAEDDGLFSELLEEVLLEVGYAVRTCRTAAEATKLAQEQVFDLALIDYHLPGTKGDLVLDAIVAQTGNCDCLMMTGDPEPSLSMDWSRRGAVGYLRKPFDPEYLLQECARVRHHRKLAASERALRSGMEELQATNERHRRLANAAMEGIWILDSDFRTSYVNTALADMLGYPPRELLGSPFENYIFPEDRDDHLRYVERRRRGEEDVYERRFRRRDGSALWALISAKPVQGRSGEFGGAFVMLTDIGEKKRTEAVLDARLRILQLVREHSLDDLLRATLDEAGDLTGSQIGFYHFYDEERQSTSLQTWSTDTATLFCGADPGKQHDSTEDAGVWVDAVRERRPVIHNDYPSLPHRKGLPEGHAPVTRELVVPVMRGDRIVAILGVGNKETPYTNEDIQSVGALADLAWDIAESKRQADVLRESETNFRAFFDSMADLIIVTSREGRILATNPALRSRLGDAASDLVGARVTDLCPATRHDRVDAILEAVLRDGVHAGNLPLQTCGGEPIPLDTRCWLGSWDGKECIFLSSRDLTAEREIRSSFARIFASNPLPMALSRLSDARFLDVNEAFLDATGHSREDVAGKTVQDIGLFRDGESFQAALHELAETRKLQNRELDLVRKDGQTRSGLLFGEVIRLGGEEVMLTLMVDIESRKQWEEALRLSEARLQSIFRVAPAGIGVVQDRRLVEVNDQVCAMTGYTQEELIGQSAEVLYPSQEEYDRVGREKYAQIAEKGTGSVETRWRCKSGNVIDVLLSSTPMHAGDLSRGVTFTALDMTVRKQLEAQLSRNQRMESIGRLVGGVAHDFNNMLCGILGHAECALEGVDPASPAAGDLHEICEAIERSAKLAQQLLAFAKQQPAAPKVLDLNKVVSGVFRMLERIVGEDIEFRWEPGTCPNIKMDPTQIDQILANLCVNARDAIMGSGAITIRTSMVHRDEPKCDLCNAPFRGDFVCLEVQDTGCGMDGETLEHVFEPFFTTKGEGKGTGLGLATVYGIVKQNAGHLEVTSELGAGTTFRIYLPTHAAPPEKQAHTRSGRMPEGGSETILVVEDEPSILSVSANALARLGYRVIAANGPQEAITTMAAQGGCIDLVVTDVIMPHMNGRQLVERLKSMRPGLKYIYTSGYTGDVLAERGIRHSDLGFIQKPFSMRALGQKIREVLDSES